MADVENNQFENISEAAKKIRQDTIEKLSKDYGVPAKMFMVQASEDKDDKDTATIAYKDDGLKEPLPVAEMTDGKISREPEDKEQFEKDIRDLKAADKIVPELAEKYDIDPADIKRELRDGKVEIYFQDPVLGQEETLGAVMQGEVALIPAADEKALKDQIKFEKTLSDLAEKSRSEAQLDIGNYGHGQALARVNAKIRDEHAAKIRKSPDRSDIKQEINTVKEAYKDMPSTPEARKAQKRAIKEIKNKDGAEAARAYDAAKKEVSILQADLDDLYQQAHKEINRARVNGAPEQSCRMSDETAKRIRQTTLELTKKKKAERDLFFAKEFKRSPIINAAKRTAEIIDKGITAIGDNGRRALASIADRVHDMNDKFRTRGITAYRNMDSQINLTTQMFDKMDYTISLSIAKAVEYYKDRVEKHYEKSAERKAAAKNIGRNLKALLTGKKPEKEEVKAAEISPEKREKHLDDIQKFANAFRSVAMKNLEHYQGLAVYNVKENERAQGLRDKEGMKESSVLKSIIDKGRADAAKANAMMEKSRPKDIRSQEKENDGERTI